MKAVKATARAKKPTSGAPVASDEEAKAQAKARARTDRGMADTKDRAIRSYRRYGLEPVWADKEQTVPVSLEMLMSLGWKIKVVGPNQFELQQPVHK